MLQVLYEDNHLIAVNKPAGMLVQGDETEDRSLMDEVKDYLKEKYNKPGKVFLGLLHRLDRPVAGIVLFAKTSKGAARLSEQIRERAIKKIYHALVVGVPEPPQSTLVHYLQKDHDRNVVTAHDSPKPDALRAELDYETVSVSSLFSKRGRQGGGLSTAYPLPGPPLFGKEEGKIAREKRYSLLKINLKTGRPHQIRAQLSAIGCPIVGDVKYGAPRALPDQSIALAATMMTFRLATKDEEKVLQIDIPEKWRRMMNACV